MNNIVKNMLEGFLTLILIIGIYEVGVAQEGTVETGQKTVIFRFPEQHVTTEWATLVETIMKQSFITNEHWGEPVIVTPENNTLCTIYRKRLNLPDCSNAVQALAVKLNPGIRNPNTDVHPGDKIDWPNLPLTKFEDNEYVFDMSNKEDVFNYQNFIRSWNLSIKEKIERDTKRIIIVHGWQIELKLKREISDFELIPLVIRDPSAAESPIIDKPRNLYTLIPPQAEKSGSPSSPSPENRGGLPPDNSQAAESSPEPRLDPVAWVAGGDFPQSQGYSQQGYAEFRETIPEDPWFSQLGYPSSMSYTSGYFPGVVPPSWSGYYSRGVYSPGWASYPHRIYQPTPIYFQWITTPYRPFYTHSRQLFYLGYP